MLAIHHYILQNMFNTLITSHAVLSVYKDHSYFCMFITVFSIMEITPIMHNYGNYFLPVGNVGIDHSIDMTIEWSITILS